MKKNPLVVIFLTVFIDLVGFGIIIPLSPYLARDFGASPFEVGLLMAVYSAMQFLFSPFWGGLSDRFGRRPVLLVSIAGTALAHLLFYLAHDLWILFLARTLAGVFGANISTAMAYIADVTTARERSKNMGLIGAAFGLGFVLGPAIAGLLSRFGESFPALVAALLSLANFTMACFVLEESLGVENRRLRDKVSRLKNIVAKARRPVVGSLLFAQFATVLAMANMEASLFLYMQDRFGWGVEKSSYGFAYVGICMAITQGFLVRRFLPIYGERRLLVAGFVFFMAGMLFTGLSPWIWLLAVAMTALALGNGFINPSVSGSISLLTPAHEQGEVLGVNQSLAALGRIFGPLMGGYAYMHLTHSFPFFAAAGLAALGLASIWRVRAELPQAGKA
jgi:MFS transporter, DHA1 family, tetracycline resistance protein